MARVARSPRPWLGLLLVTPVGCHRPPAPAPMPPTVDDAGCVDALRRRHGIDAAAEPRLCAALTTAADVVAPLAGPALRGLVVVRDRGDGCGAACPDLATQLLADATLAYYQIGRHELHVTDAAFDGPRWRGGAPTPARVATYLAELGLDGPGLVARVHALPGADLRAADPSGAEPAVMDTIVRLGPPVLMAGTPALDAVLVHELAHVIQLRTNAAGQVAAWSSWTGWTESGSGEVADGHVGGAFASERPQVASRLLLGLTRGEAWYQPAPTGPPTPYARFDPMEDFAESVRLAWSDPVGLGRRSPVRLVASAAPSTLRAPAVRAYLVPGLRGLLSSPEAAAAMRVVRRLGSVVLPEAAALVDPRPLPVPADASPHERALVAEAELVVTVGGLALRPTDAAFA
ncbi:MAG: hypothetical protein KA190_32430, partial [Kofleriaceae bacterium]|nr:hypothetical protein [Kofleriaceae bacterium]